MKRAGLLFGIALASGLMAWWLVSSSLAKQYAMREAALRRAWALEKEDLLNNQPGRGGSDFLRVRSRQQRYLDAHSAGPGPEACLEQLRKLAPDQFKDRNILYRKVIQQLEQLVDLGPAALPSIRQALREKVDIVYGGRDTNLAPATLRLGLFEVLGRIAGPEAEDILLETLAASRQGGEVRALARILEDMAPGKHRESVVAAALALMEQTSGLDPSAARRERDSLYEVLGRAGDQSRVLAAQNELITSNGKIDETARRYLDRVLGDQGVSVFHQALLDPRLKDSDDQEEMVELIARRLGKNPEAQPILQQIALNSALDRDVRQEAMEALGRIGDASLVETAQNELITERGRIDETALRYLERTLGNQTLQVIQQAWADPRLTDNDQRRELLEVVIDRAGQSDQASQMLAAFAIDPQQPSDLRRTAIAELDNEGINESRPTEKDHHIAASRIELLKQVAPFISDPSMAAKVNEVYQNLHRVLQRPAQPPRPPRP